MKTLACDPGSKTSALVVRDGHDCLDVELVVRGDGFADYFDQVLDAAMQMSLRHEPDLHAVEDVVPPSPHLGITDPGPLLETAKLVGAFMVHGWLVVRPDKFGKVPDLPAGPVLDAYMAASYPDRLLGPREKGGSYGGQLRHARSAYALAAAAERATREQRLFGGTS